MRKLKYILFSLVLFSCEQEEFTGTGLESLREFMLTPIAGSKINLNSVDRDGEIVINWDEARSGFDSEVTYTWMLDKVDGDFSSPLISRLSDKEGKEQQITFTNEELDNFLEDLGLSTGEEMVVKWTVSATNGDITQVAESATLTIKRFENAIAPFDLISPTDSAIVELDIDNPATQVVVDWDSTFAGFGDEITYTWLADEEGGDFSEPLIERESGNMGKNHQLTITHQEMEDLLESFGVEEGQSLTFNWKVIAVGGGLERETEAFTLTIKRFNPFVPPTNIYLVGGSTSADWNPPASVPFRSTGDGTFEIFEYIEVAGDGFKLLEVQASYEGDWGMDAGNPGTLMQEGEQNLSVPEDGFYRITVDFNSLSYTIEKVQWAIIGSGTPNGWDESNDTNMNHSGTKGDYTWTVDATLTDGELKFRANDAWDVNFGDNEGDGIVEYGGTNIGVAAGNVTISLILDPESGYSYTIN